MPSGASTRAAASPGLPACSTPRRARGSRPARSDADKLAAVIDVCPSGALSYTRTDGAAHGRRGHAADEDPTAARRADDQPAAAGGDDTAAEPAGMSVTPRLNGPLVVDGPVTLVGPDGTIEVTDRLFLCRCGGSSTKPRCDGTHKRIGFQAAGVAPPERTSS